MSKISFLIKCKKKFVKKSFVKLFLLCFKVKQNYINKSIFINLKISKLKSNCLRFLIEIN